MTTTALPEPAAHPPLRRGPKDGLLRSLRAAREATTAWEVEAARLVTDWVSGHRIAEHLTAPSSPLVESVIELDEGVVRPSLPGLQSPMRLAGPGAPLVWDLPFCELATTLSMSLDAARGYVGEVTELCFRRPSLWERVRSGEVRLWRAREVARSTTRLPADGAAWVDAQLAPVLGSCSGAQVRRAVSAALHRFDPEAAEADRRTAADGQHFTFHFDTLADPQRPGSDGVVPVDGLLDTADALDLDAAVAARAAQLRSCGSAGNGAPGDRPGRAPPGGEVRGTRADAYTSDGAGPAVRLPVRAREARDGPISTTSCRSTKVGPRVGAIWPRCADGITARRPMPAGPT